ncbi:MAG TPA: ABC transporter permease [Phycisphaerales bacterium]|nr:ABC transporter permease [Phycisphaerales bacterium]
MNRYRPWLLLAPFLIFDLLLVLAPLSTVVWQSLHIVSPDYEMLPGLTLANYKRALDPAYLPALSRSFLYAGTSTFLALLLGYPLAYFIALKAGRYRSTLLVLLMLPFWTSYLVRTYAWMTLLQTEGVINGLLLKLHLIEQPLHMLNTSGAVILGLTYCFLPFATLPIYVALEGLDTRLLEAAEDLGANAWQTFRSVIWPLSLPGVVAGGILSFVPAVGDFVSADILGGPDDHMIGNVIQQQYLGSFNWPFGSALSMLMIVLMGLAMMVYVKTEERGE